MREIVGNVLSEFTGIVGVSEFMPESSKVWICVVVAYLVITAVFWVVFVHTDTYIYNCISKKDLLEGILLYVFFSLLTVCGTVAIYTATYLNHRSVEDLQSMAYKQEISTEAGTAKLKEDGEKGIKVVYDLKKGQPSYYDRLYIKASWFSGTIYIKHQEEKEVLFVETASNANKK